MLLLFSEVLLMYELLNRPSGVAFQIKPFLCYILDDGKVIKAINTKSADSYQEVEPFIIEEISVFPPHVAVTFLKVLRPRGKSPRLLVGSHSRIYTIALARCYKDKIMSCRCDIMIIFKLESCLVFHCV